MPSVLVSVETKIHDDQWTEIESRLKTGVEVLKVKTANTIRNGAEARAPKRTGYLAGTITAAGGTVLVGAHYGVFVNYGTRFMRAEPFLTHAVVYEGIPVFTAGLRQLIGNGHGGGYIATDVAPFLEGPDKGRHMETWLDGKWHRW
jgi:hypothetical protein